MSSTAGRSPASRSSSSGTENAYDAKTPVRFPAEPPLLFTPGQVITLKRSSRIFARKSS